MSTLESLQTPLQSPLQNHSRVHSRVHSRATPESLQSRLQSPLQSHSKVHSRVHSRVIAESTPVSTTASLIPSLLGCFAGVIENSATYLPKITKKASSTKWRASRAKLHWGCSLDANFGTKCVLNAPQHERLLRLLSCSQCFIYGRYTCRSLYFRFLPDVRRLKRLEVQNPCGNLY